MREREEECITEPVCMAPWCLWNSGERNRQDTAEALTGQNSSLRASMHYHLNEHRADTSAKAKDDRLRYMEACVMELGSEQQGHKESLTTNTGMQDGVLEGIAG